MKKPIPNNISLIKTEHNIIIKDKARKRITPSDIFIVFFFCFGMIMIMLFLFSKPELDFQFYGFISVFTIIFGKLGFEVLFLLTEKQEIEMQSDFIIIRKKRPIFSINKRIIINEKLKIELDKLSFPDFYPSLSIMIKTLANLFDFKLPFINSNHFFENHDNKTKSWIVEYMKANTKNTLSKTPENPKN